MEGEREIVKCGVMWTACQNVWNPAVVSAYTTYEAGKYDPV